MFVVAPVAGLACSSDAMPSVTILSFSSRMMRWAALGPMPFTVLSIFSFPDAMVLQRSPGVVADNTIRAVFPPMPLTVMRRRYSSLSCLVANPKRENESSRPPVTNCSWTKTLTSWPAPVFWSAVYVFRVIARAYPTPWASTTANAGESSVSSPLMYSIILKAFFMYHLTHVNKCV